MSCNVYIVSIVLLHTLHITSHRSHHVKFALLVTVVRIRPAPRYHVNQESGHQSAITLWVAYHWNYLQNFICTECSAWCVLLDPVVLFLLYHQYYVFSGSIVLRWVNCKFMTFMTRLKNHYYIYDLAGWSSLSSLSGWSQLLCSRPCCMPWGLLFSTGLLRLWSVSSRACLSPGLHLPCALCRGATHRRVYWGTGLYWLSPRVLLS